jgi:hypothetical protein
MFDAHVRAHAFTVLFAQPADTDRTPARRVVRDRSAVDRAARRAWNAAVAR